MADIRNLIRKMAAAEAAFTETRFVAPCLRGGRVRARVGGIVQTFPVEPADFEGWGIFQARDVAGGGRVAGVVEEADLPLMEGYLKQFPRLRLRLARQLAGQTWLGYPTTEADMRQRFGVVAPVAVHLTTEGTAFEQVTARNVGGAYWFEEVDRRSDPLPAERLRDALAAETEPDAVAFSGLTPEMRTVYELVTQADARFQERRAAEAATRTEQERLERLRLAREQYRADHGDEWYIEAHRAEYDEAWRRAEQAAATVPAPAPGQRRRNRRGDNLAHGQGDDARLREALALGGGELRDYSDRGEYWLVEWRTRDGQRHNSAIAKADMTVLSSGICLSGRDRDFDLQSLVGVIERRGPEEW